MSLRAYRYHGPTTTARIGGRATLLIEGKRVELDADAAYVQRLSAEGRPASRGKLVRIAPIKPPVRVEPPDGPTPADVQDPGTEFVSPAGRETNSDQPAPRRKRKKRSEFDG